MNQEDTPKYYDDKKVFGNLSCKNKHEMQVILIDAANFKMLEFKDMMSNLLPFGI